MKGRGMFLAAAVLGVLTAPTPARAVESLDCQEMTRLRMTAPEDRAWRCVPLVAKTGPGAYWRASAMNIMAIYGSVGTNASALVMCYCPGSQMPYDRWVSFKNFTMAGEPYPMEYHHFAYQDCAYSIGAGK